MKRAWPLAVLAVQPLILFWTTLIARTTHIPWDLTGFHVPLAAVVVDALRHGRFPLWEPYSYAGYPFHADMQAQLFYPPAWLGFALGVWRDDAIFYWLEWLVALHLILAGVGAYLLLRALACGRGAALFGATAFQLGCFFASQAQHLGAVSAAAWMPFAWLGVVQLAERFTPKRLAVLAIALAMTFLAGLPAVTLVAFGTTACLAVGLATHPATQQGKWRLPVAVLAAFVVAAGLSAVQLMPSIELSSQSTAANRWTWSEPGTLPVRALAGAIWPNWLHVFTPFDRSLFKETGNFTFFYFYNGQFTVWLALGALFVRKGPARLFLLLAALCVLALCGGPLPGYLASFHRLPRMLQSSIYTEFVPSGFSLAMAVAAALTLQRLTQHRARWAAAVALGTGLELLLVASNRPMNTGEGGWKGHDSTRQVMHDPRLLAELRRMVRGAFPPLRTDTLEYSPRFTSSAPLLRLPSANGDNPLAPLRMLAYRGIYSKVVPWERQYPIEDFDSRWIDAANVGFLIREGPPLDAGRLNPDHWQQVAMNSQRPLTVYRNLSVLPRYRLMARVRLAMNREEARSLLASGDPATTAVVEGVLGGPQQPIRPRPIRAATVRESSPDAERDDKPRPIRAATVRERSPDAERDKRSLTVAAPMGGFNGTVEVLSYTPEEVELRVESAGESFLLAAEGYAPGWRATVDGAAHRVYPANVAFMGLPVPAGRHIVILEYAPASLGWWAGVSALSWCGLGVWVVARTRRPKTMEC